MTNILNSIPLEVKNQLINLGKVISLMSLAIFIIVFIVVIIDRQKRKDYSDETGYINFRFFNLSWIIILIIVSVLIYSVLLGISL